MIREVATAPIPLSSFHREPCFEAAALALRVSGSPCAANTELDREPRLMITAGVGSFGRDVLGVD